MKHFGILVTAALGTAMAFSIVAGERSSSPAQEEQGDSASWEHGRSPHSSYFPNVFLRDVVVSNTDPSLKNTDLFYNSEPSIAVNPVNRREIVISSFSGAWTPPANSTHFRNAPLWYSKDGGRLWTKEFTIPAPAGVPRGALALSPCDETFAYGRDGTLYGTFLVNGNGEEGADCSSDDSASSTRASDTNLFGEIYTGATSNPASADAWRWFVVNGKTQPTNQYPPDQPWVLTNGNPDGRGRENVFVAYQSSAMQVAVAAAGAPPEFTLDRSPGAVTSFGGNPGHRIAADHRSGAVYSLYQTAASIECGSASAVRYMLNRSIDGGKTWELNGYSDGIEVAQACSHQNLFTYLFGEPEPGVILGGVNSLRGGIDALAVDSRTGAVYVVYGQFDEVAGRDRILMKRLTNRGDGRMEPGPAHYVSDDKHQSALPAVGVTEDEDGSVGVLYDTADGLDEATSLPYFSIHLAVSRDRGENFHTVLLQKFLFPENAPRGGGPRPLGDYQQLKSLGRSFYGVFSGDGQPFGRPFHKIDPIFFTTTSR